MVVNVLSWKLALAQGYHPECYSYLFDAVPTGEYQAVLDFKIWAKKLMAVNCYFTQATTGKKIQLTVYCNEAGVYQIGDVNFATCPLQRIYLITVVAGQKKKIVFSNAVAWN